MKNKITIRQMMAAARSLKEQGEQCTLLGVGPMSKTFLDAALELAGRYWEKYSVWLVRHHQFYLDSKPLYFQCHRLCGAGGLQAGLYL